MAPGAWQEEPFQKICRPGGEERFRVLGRFLRRDGGSLFFAASLAANRRRM